MLNRRVMLSGLAITALGAATFRRAFAHSVTTDEIGDQVQTVKKGQLPDFIPPEQREIRTLYRYAVEHADALQYMPCFCGCVRFGHTSNRECYVKSWNADGTVTFTSHAAT